jgi:hypothetical protein
MGSLNGAAFIGPKLLLTLYNSTGAMMVVDQSSAQVTAIFPLGMAPLAGEVADSAGGIIYIGGAPYGGNLVAVSTQKNRVIESFPVLEFTPSAVDGAQIYGAGSETIYEWPARVYSLATGSIATLPSPVSSGGIVEWYGGGSPPDGKTYWARFAIVGGGGITFANGVAVYSTTTNSVIAKFSIPIESYNPIVFSPDSSTAYIAEPDAIEVYSTATFQKTATYPCAETFSALALSPDGSVLYATAGLAIYAFDAFTGTQSHVFPLPARVQNFAMALSLDGTTLYLLGSGVNSVDLVNTATGKVTAVPVPYPPTSVAVR